MSFESETCVSVMSVVLLFFYLQLAHVNITAVYSSAKSNTVFGMHIVFALHDT